MTRTKATVLNEVDPYDFWQPLIQNIFWRDIVARLRRCDRRSTSLTTVAMNEEELRKRKAEIQAQMEAGFRRQVEPTSHPVELPANMWEALDHIAARLGVSRDALIRVWLDEHLQRRKQ